MATNRFFRHDDPREASGRDIIFIGNFFPPGVLKNIRQDQKATGFSNHNFESSILDGLNETIISHPEIDVEVICIPRLYSYPHHNRRLWIPSEYYRRGELTVRSVSIFNLVVINKIWVGCALFSQLCAASWRRWRRRGDRQPKRPTEVILNIPTAYLELPLLIWKSLFSRRSLTTLIIPDIPQMVSAINHLTTRSLRGRLVSWFDSLSMRLASRFNRFVFLTDAMKEFFKGEREYIVMEGISSSDNNPSAGETQSGNRSLLYSGTLASAFGILDLLEGFEMARIEGVELWICGSGETEGIIREAEKRNPAIKFFGLVDSATARRLQAEATVLVNPRTSAGEFTRYSFPSKILEYMQAGKPVIMHPLPGIPQEYLDIACLPETETPRGLAEEIRRVFSMSDSERVELGRRGRELALSKSAPMQVARILGL